MRSQKSFQQVQVLCSHIRTKITAANTAVVNAYGAHQTGFQAVSCAIEEAIVMFSPGAIGK